MVTNGCVGFFYIGSMRSGSTWLYHVLSNISEISVHKDKESYFFDRKYSSQRLDEYEKKFMNVDSSKVKIDISPTYTENIESLYRIKKYNSRAKFIFVYRDHCDLVVSQYCYLIANGFNPGDFASFWLSLKKEKFLFSQYLNTLVKLFGADNILIFKYKDVMNDKINYLRKIFVFLGVGNCLPNVHFVEKKVNSSALSPVFPVLYRFFRLLGSVFVPLVGLRRVRGIRSKVDSIFRRNQVNCMISIEEKSDVTAYYDHDRASVLSLIETLDSVRN